MAGFLVFLYSILLLSITFILSNSGQLNDEGSEFISIISAVVDCSTRVGREEKIAMDIAVQDIYRLTGHNLALHVLDLPENSARAAFAAIDLIQNQKLEAIVGSITWHQAALVAEMVNITIERPIISLTTGLSLIVPDKELPVISMYQDISVQIECIASIVASFKWPKVIAIYEDRYSYTSDLGIITLLSASLQDSGVQLEHYSAFPTLSSLLDPNTTIQNELNKLKGKQSRVFVLLQSSLTLANLLFENAKKMRMMRRGYVWIAAASITGLLDSVNSSMMTSMQGVLGCKASYLDTTASFKDFEVKFERKFRAEYPEDRNSQPSIFALRAYDAIWTVAKSSKMLHEKNYSKTLLQHILSSDFEGLSGRIHFTNYKLTYVPNFQIVNIVGKSYRELGFWSPEFGFTDNLVKNNSVKDKSQSGEEVLNPVYWPGGKISVPTGLSESNLLEDRGKQLRIAVPAKSMFKQFVRVSHDEIPNITYITGFSVGVFEAAVKCLRYALMYEIVPFHGSYDDMVMKVSQKAFDAAVGDIVITASRDQPIEFSQPYVESGFVMLVAMKSDKSHHHWWFLKVYTKEMWFLMAAMTVFTGFAIWVVEHETERGFNGSSITQIGSILWYSVSILTSAQGESFKSPWSRFLSVPWFFLVLIVTSS